MPGANAQARHYATRHSAEWMREYRQRVRLRVIALYGGTCQCCGVADWQFLTIDHTNRDGATERGTSAGRFWRSLVNQPRRADLRLLCYNCHAAIDFYGQCPHQQEEPCKASSQS